MNEKWKTKPPTKSSVTSRAPRCDVTLMSLLVVVVDVWKAVWLVRPVATHSGDWSNQVAGSSLKSWLMTTDVEADGDATAALATTASQTR